MLSERTTKIVIMIVLIMLFFQPIFESETYSILPASSDQALLFVADMYNSKKNWTAYQVAAK